jgi:Flp pilus assembly protein TadG
MSPPRSKSRFRREGGVIIILVAIFLLFVVGAMAALSIDVVTFYTARSEAQLAADAGALAGARVLANSGATSDLTGASLTAAQNLAKPVAIQFAQTNLVGGQTVPAGQVQVWFNGNGKSPCATPQTGEPNNPCITVQVTANLPVFFARIWGSTQVTIVGTATAEAYNPSGLATDVTTSQGGPVAPSCVKPWLLPNIDPTSSSGNPTPIFAITTGQIQDSALLGWETPVAPGSSPRLEVACGLGGDCATRFPSKAAAWAYLPADTSTSFPPPSATSVTCTASAGFTSYQLSVAGCVQTPIACNDNTSVKIDLSDNGNRNSETAAAVNCLAHTEAGHGDKVDESTGSPYYPFEFTAGEDDPLVKAGSIVSGKDIFVSDSLVTVPVFDSTVWPPPQTVQVIGFVQLFLSPEGQQTGNNGHIHTMVTNMVGCGTNSNAVATTPIYGNGASAVPVRLISPP